MVSHLLVAFETDQEDNDALTHAIGIAQASGARITLVRLFDSSSDRNRFVDPLDWHMRKLEVELGLKQWGQELRKSGVSVHTEVVDGSKAEHLVRYAQAQTVDLIVLVKRMGRISELLHNLIKRTPIPVLVLHAAGSPPEPSGAYQKLLVPLDGSQRAEFALSLAAQFARLFNAQIVVAHVLHKPDMPRSTPPSIEDQALLDQIVENNNNEMIPYLKRIAAQLPGKVETRLLISDNVALTLVKLAEEEGIDLIVLGAHGYSGIPQQPYGNVTNSVMTYSPKPVLVVQDLPEAEWAQEGSGAVPTRAVTSGASVQGQR